MGRPVSRSFSTQHSLELGPPCTSGYNDDPRNVATVGKKSAPQKVLVTEMGSVSGGRVDWIFWRAGTCAKTGSKCFESGIRGTVRRRNLRSCEEKED